MDCIVKKIDLTAGESVLEVTYDDGHIANFDAQEVVKDWLTMSSQDFREIYGFYWMPPSTLIEKVEKVLELC